MSEQPDNNDIPMPDLKKKSTLSAYLKGVIPTAEDFEAVGLAVEKDDVPDVKTWVRQLKEVKEEDPQDLKPARVQVAVQRIMVDVAATLRERYPDNADQINRSATAAIPRFTDKIVGA